MNLANRILIDDVVNLIEENLKNKLSLDEIAEKLFISKYHLHRLFRAIAGIPLISYVRGRKLTFSIIDLLENKMNIIEIAYKYNFDYEQSYERAFKRLFKITPSSFRQQRCELSVVQRIDTSLINDTSHGILISPRYCMKPLFHLGGIESLIVHSENQETYTANVNARDFYYKRRFELINRINDPVYYGLITYMKPSANYYMPSVEVSDPFSSNPPFTCRTIETCNYAVFRYVGFHSPDELTIVLLNEIYDLIDMKWRLITQFKQPEFHFERLDLKICSSTYCEADIYIPIKM